MERSKELDVRAQAFQLISIFNWKLDRECIDGVTGSLKGMTPTNLTLQHNRIIQPAVSAIEAAFDDFV